MTTHVIVRDVSPNVSDCQLVCNDRVPINLERLREQHKGYVDNIRQAATLHGGGLNLIELPALEAYPDSMFVEDVALMFDSFALITRPGAETRQGETEHIAPTVANLMESLGRPVYRIEEPGTLDGGDVLIIGKHAFVGRSTRTNDEGFTQVKAFAAKHGYTTHQVGVRGGMHLKCAASMITPKTVLINPKWIERTTFTTIGFGVLDVEPGEPDSANVLSFLLKKDSSEPGLRIIVVPERFPALAAKLEKYASRSANRSATAGEDSAEILRVVVTAVDEVAKAEGALTCCSLIAYS